MTKKKTRNSYWSYKLKPLAKIAGYRPSRLFASLFLVGLSIFLLGGGIYDIIIKPAAIIPLGSGVFLTFVPYRLHEQLLMGSIGIMILYALSTVGLLMIYYSSKNVGKPRQSSFLIWIGMFLLLVAFIFTEVVIFWILNY